MFDLQEDPTLVWITGAVALTFAGILFAQTQSRLALAVMVGVVALTAALTVTERWMVTPREQVVAALTEFSKAIEQNDLPGVKSHLAPNATEVRALADDLMPQLDIQKARFVGSVEVIMPAVKDPTTATAHFRGYFYALHKKAGVEGGQPFKIEVDLIREQGKWLIESYNSQENFRAQAARLGRQGGEQPRNIRTIDFSSTAMTS